MGDQRADQQNHAALAGFQFSLRLMLLLVALCCTLFATIWAVSRLSHENSEYRLNELEGRKIDMEGYDPSDPEISNVKREIDELRARLGKNPDDKN